MIHEDFDGTVREVHWGELQENANRFANVLRAHGVERGDRVAMLLPPTPETAAAFFGTYKLRGDPAVDVGALRRRRHPPPRHGLAGEGARHQRGQQGPRRPVAGRARAACSTTICSAGGEPTFDGVDTAADDPAQLYYSSGTTGLAKGIVHAHRYLLAHEEFVYCHDVQDGELFHGMGEWAWAAGIAPLLGPWRLGAVQFVYQRKGGFDPHKQLDFLSRHEVDERLHDADRDALDDVDHRTPASATRRSSAIVCCAGEPLNPEAIRWFREQYGSPCSTTTGSPSPIRWSPTTRSWTSARARWASPMPGWDVQILDEDEKPLPQGERGEICLRARSNPHYPLGYWHNDEASEETFGGEWFHTKDAASLDEDGYVWYEGRADDVIIAAGYRIGPFEVESACLEHAGGRRGGGGRLARRAPRQRGQGVHRARRGPRGLRRARQGDPGARARPAVRVRVPAQDRVRRRAAQDADRQDPADRAAPGGAGGGQGERQVARM